MTISADMVKVLSNVHFLTQLEKSILDSSGLKPADFYEWWNGLTPEERGAYLLERMG